MPSMFLTGCIQLLSVYEQLRLCLDCEGLERIGPCIVGEKEEFFPGGVDGGSEHTLYRYMQGINILQDRYLVSQG
jgi:hypothetical protein